MAEPATAIIVFAHGSKVAAANETIARLAEEVSCQTGWPAAAAFLDVTQPDLRAAVASAVQAGARRVVIIPCFLVYGVHVREDLPRLVRQMEAAHPGVELLVSPPLEGHPGLAEILAGRVREALAAQPAGPSRSGKG